VTLLGQHRGGRATGRPATDDDGVKGGVFIHSQIVVTKTED
jgi:hypothetical protein